MNIYIICDSNHNTYYTGKSIKIKGKRGKVPEFSSKLDRAKAYKKLHHARSARSQMGLNTKLHNIDILEYETIFIGKH